MRFPPVRANSLRIPGTLRVDRGVAVVVVVRWRVRVVRRAIRVGRFIVSYL